MLRFYRKEVPETPEGVKSEWCFYVQTKEDLTSAELEIVQWLLAETFEPDNFGQETFLGEAKTLLEVGPRLNFETAWSTTAVSIFRACGINKITRIERSRRFGFSDALSTDQQKEFVDARHDRMTEMQYEHPLESFDSGLSVEPVRIIPVIEEGIDALRRINIELGLGMDEQDIKMYFNLFVEVLKRNPTDVELCQLGQSNSEHSRHGFFKALQVIDGETMPYNLMEIIKAPLKENPGNSLVAFGDDSSAIMGNLIRTILPSLPGQAGKFIFADRTYHPILTAETHNHPSGVEPYQGAATGKGGELRDRFAMRRSGLVSGGGAGYCVGNLHIPGYELPWEKDGWQHPNNLASPLDILIQASNGASDYGNCFGDPVIYGITRSLGLVAPDGYRSWYKPLMYSVGVGQFDDVHKDVKDPAKGMLVVQVGGPAYRIGIGGGSASSMISGANAAELDFASVQRGDAQMEQRVSRLSRACVELADDNPIVCKVDLGAGGDCNGLPELVVPAGARIELRDIPVGDQTLSGLEIWCNESQERVAFLVWPDRFDQIKEICDREGIPCAIVGQVTGDGYLILHDENDGTEPVNLPLDKVLGELPQKTFKSERITLTHQPLELPADLTILDALDRVLRLVSVGSKRFLTTKVDRSVTGLIAQQQCVGPNQLTLSDYAVVAQSHFGLTGTALSLGEQPVRGLISAEAMARGAVAEMILNMAGACITKLEDIKCSGNWMLAAKEPGQGAWLYDAACATRDIMMELGIAIDGGKDSLSMAAKTKGPDGETHIVKAPGELVVAGYATMDDITEKVTADIKYMGGRLLFIDLAKGKNRLGGSALAQVYGQLGDECPDVEDVDLLKRTFKVVQELVYKDMVSSVHDRSDGGLITTLLEMAFAGNVGLNIEVHSDDEPIATLFSEELGLVLECENSKLVSQFLMERGIPVQYIGIAARTGGNIGIDVNGQSVLNEPMIELRSIWESTSTAIDKLQANPISVEEESRHNHFLITEPPYRLMFDPTPTPPEVMEAENKPRVAVLREKGSNGDREMAAAFVAAGFEVWDVTMTDLTEGKITLDEFRGIIFPGGFSFADVLDAGKGWAGAIRFNDRVAKQFEDFYNRPDTFSFGVCNGCQLMALLGWVPWRGIDPEFQPRFIRNYSGRFESRFSTVSIERSPAIMLKNMEGTQMGVWVAHGEGRMHIPDQQMIWDIANQELAPIRYINGTGMPTLDYPYNPNGSTHGIAALCSPDGRHLAMMPHPERAFQLWQWPWLPSGWRGLEASPWLQLFRNAYEWCKQK